MYSRFELHSNILAVFGFHGNYVLMKLVGLRQQLMWLRGSQTNPVHVVCMGPPLQTIVAMEPRRILMQV